MGSISGTSICDALDKEPSGPSEKLKISVTGAASPLGYIVCRDLKRQGHYVIASDWTENYHTAKHEFCDEYHVVDQRDMDNCLKVTREADYVYNLAMFPGGPGFSESDPSATEDDYTVVGYNMAEAARINGVQRFLHASAVLLQVETNVYFKESFAWLAERQYPDGFEDPETEKLCMSYHKDFGFQYRIARFYCIYGLSRAWEGGRGKAPAAFCGEGSTSTIYHKYAEDVLRLMMSDSRDPVFIGCLDWREPVNIQNDEIESENETAEMGLSLEEKKLPILPIPGPEGIGGRNSDDAGIEEKVGCAEALKDWLGMTCFWIKERIEKVKAKGIDSSIDGSSEVVGSEAPVELGSLRTAEGKE